MNLKSISILLMVVFVGLLPVSGTGTSVNQETFFTADEGDCSVPTSQRIAIQNATAAFIEVEFSVVANATISLTPTVCDGSFAAEGIITLDLEENLSSYSWRYDDGILIMDNIGV